MIPGQVLKKIGEVYNHFAVLAELDFLHKRINEIFLFGPLEMGRTLTPSGTTGNQTINKIAGTVNFAAGSSVLVVTNSFAKESSIIFAVVRTNDTTAVIKNVVPASGSFTIRLSSAATAETSVGFLITN